MRNRTASGGSTPPGDNNTKPPRPTGKSSVQINTAAPTNRGNRNGGIRMGTPPRPGQDPGTQVDQDFVTDDWDDGMDNDSPRNVNKGKGRDEKQTGSGNNTNNKNVSAGSAVDPNWLDEDFDD